MKKPLKFLVIHCTATPAGREVSASEIRRWHTSPKEQGGRGWKQVGYSQLILLDGRIEQLVGDNGDNWVDQDEITNGAVGINAISKHICYVGGVDAHGKPADTRTAEQVEAMAKYVKQFVGKHPNVVVAGHYHFANKACPSFNVSDWLLRIGINKKNIYRAK